MSRESHEQFLKQAALREAQKAISRRGGGAFKKEDLYILRIQTLEPWKRVSLFALGIFICGFGVFAMKEFAVWLGVIAILVGVFLAGAAIIGKKRTVVAALDGIDLLTLFEGFF